MRIGGALGALGLAVAVDRLGGPSHGAFFWPFAALVVVAVINIAFAALLWRNSRAFAHAEA